MPHALVTTPESLSLLLSQPEHPKTFACLECVIVDEWHELMGSKRGVQTELCLARLRRLRTGLRTWGLSATIGNLEEALAYLVGVSAPGRLVRGVAAKETLIESLYPETMERFPWGGHLGLNLLEQVLDLLSRARSTLLFTNVRSQTEAWYRAILEARPEWSDQVALHHGSLDRELREYAERGIAAGALRCVVCTSSLDLGVDFAAVDQVLQVGSPKGIARLLQRAGRSGHRPGEVSRLTFIPAHALEYVEIAAARDAMTRGEIEDRRPPVAPLDVLAQHAITIAAGGGFEESELLREVRSTRSYQRLSDVQWQWVMDFATRGGPALGNYGEYRRVILENGRYVIASDRIAQRHRMSIGTISGDQTVNVRYLTGRTLGTIEESFISKLTSGSRFLFAGKTLELVRFQDTSAYVRKASQPDGLVPRWMGNRMSFSTQLATAVSIAARKWKQYGRSWNYSASVL
jgi:ATP-dependent Lhr-like helicase